MRQEAREGRKDDVKLSHTKPFVEYLAGRACPVRLDRATGSECCVFMSNHNCEAYTASSNALPLKPEITLTSELPLENSMKAKTFDKAFDNNEDISEYLDFSKATRPGRAAQVGRVRRTRRGGFGEIALPNSGHHNKTRPCKQDNKTT